jgi:hypothetical protein
MHHQGFVPESQQLCTHACFLEMLEPLLEAVHGSAEVQMGPAIWQLQQVQQVLASLLRRSASEAPKAEPRPLLTVQPGHNGDHL